MHIESCYNAHMEKKNINIFYKTVYSYLLNRGYIIYDDNKNDKSISIYGQIWNK